MKTCQRQNTVLMVYLWHLCDYQSNNNSTTQDILVFLLNLKVIFFAIGQYSESDTTSQHCPTISFNLLQPPSGKIAGSGSLRIYHLTLLHIPGNNITVILTMLHITVYSILQTQ